MPFAAHSQLTTSAPRLAAADRRHEPRAERAQTVRAYDPAAGRSLTGVTRDLSRSGLCAEFDGRHDQRPHLRVGQALTLHIAGPRRPGASGAAADGSVAHRLLTARVVWLAPVPGRPGTLACGLELASGAPCAAHPARLAA